ncbi:MAG: alpha-amylase family glycosyl hydrolase [Candidatus Cyclobacteriaceae bacterium M3_2C_046]
MIRNYLIGLLFFISSSLLAKEDITPKVEPATFDANTEITVTFDVTGNPLADLSNAYLWAWIPNTSIEARYNVNPASSNTELSDQVKFIKKSENDITTFSLTFKPQQLFADPICNTTQMGIILKGNDWNDGQTEDVVLDITPLENCFIAELIAPARDPAFTVTGETIAVQATASENAVFTLSVDGVSQNTQAGNKTYAYNYLVNQPVGNYPAQLVVKGASGDTTITFNLLVNEPSPVQPRPAGIIPGINYDPAQPATATLCLLAPDKKVAYVLGEFNDFEMAPSSKMYRDGEYFWLEINGLTTGVEYAYQYLVDGVFIADPFAEKILDPDDQFIPDKIYPELKPYPAEALRDDWYANRLAVLETGQSLFNWTHDTYQKPKKEDLVVYELLVRDFFAPDDRNYLNLIDTLSYFKSLGINAIELMPVQEFSGNDSWGYNPTFMFAPDKAYGTEQALKQFVDAAHAQGIAVILDVVFNQQEFPNPYVALWFDYNSFKVTPDNPFFNVNATHPFSVFYDMNHESEYTQFYMDTTLHYWINEYKVDGFRFDLSKGFTQNQGNDPEDVAAWGNYDQSRIDLLKRMANEVQKYAPQTWLILEHFADNDEEKELADFGFMFWGNMHNDYKEAILGFPENKTIDWGYFETRDWNNNNLISYMESHDEERQVYDALNFGNSKGDYNVQTLNTALDRVKIAAAFFFTIPGPKMLWQFGELGYDISINEGGRTSTKPVKWEYYADPARKKLYEVFSTLINLKVDHPVFEQGTFSWKPDGKIKTIQLIQGDDQLYVMGNFDVEPQEVELNLPSQGTWYDLFSTGQLEAGSVKPKLELQPGQFHVLTTFQVPDVAADLTGYQLSLVTGIEDYLKNESRIYPNPAADQLIISGKPSDDIKVLDIAGKSWLDQVTHNYENRLFRLDISRLPTGFYLIKVGNEVHRFMKI